MKRMRFALVVSFAASIGMRGAQLVTPGPDRLLPPGAGRTDTR